MWLVGGVLLHVFDDDALSASHSLGARRTVVHLNRTEVVEEILPETPLSRELQRLELRIVQLDVAKICLAGQDGIFQQVVQGDADIHHSQQTSAEGVQAGQGFHFGGKTLLACPQLLLGPLAVGDVFDGKQDQLGLVALMVKTTGVEQHDPMSDGWEDRKSTRLNSSHLGISYA